MPRQGWSEGTNWVTAAGTAIANTTTETAIFAAPTIPANYFQDGRIVKVIAYGQLSTTGTPTIRFGLRYGTATGGTLLWQSEALTNGSGVTTANWGLEIILQTRSNGSSATVIGAGWAMVNTASTPTNVAQIVSVSGWDAMATATIDATTATALTLTATWGTPSASNTLTGHIHVIEVLN